MASPTVGVIACGNTVGLIEQTIAASNSGLSYDPTTDQCRKLNRPQFLQGQCWVLLAAVLSRGRRYGSALPLLARLQHTVGNRSKLQAACVLLRVVGAIFQECYVRVLLDCWYLRCRVIQYTQAWGFAVIGQSSGGALG